MLEKLSINNVALIESAEIIFSDGLNVLSGETGAGKSVILESLNFVLGAKAEKSMIRSGQNDCRVSAIFNVENNEKIKELFDEMDFDAEDEVIISRKFSIDGKSSIKLNGNTVTASMLRKFTSCLVDVHGQSEHYELLSNSNQLNLIDKIGGSFILELKTQLKEKYTTYKDVKSKIDELGGNENQREYRLDILNFQINEIENCGLYEGEEEILLAQKSHLQNQEKILSVLDNSRRGIDDEGCINDILLNVIKLISSITSFDAKYDKIYQQLLNVSSEIDDVSSNLSTYLEELNDFDGNIDEIEDRLDFIKTLKRKYGNSVAEIFEYLNNAKIEKDQLDNFDKNFDELLKNKKFLEKEIYDLYIKLSNKRKEIAKDFSIGVLDELKQLGMPNSQFEVVFNDFPVIEECNFNSYNGVDSIQFVFSANKGEQIKPLTQIISGGEMSRFMLAIKARSAKFNDINTFVFDEIDAGISGNIALVVSKKFAQISKDVQIIAVTHLPQIASMADNNLFIQKNEFADYTLTTIYPLDRKGKVKEVARLAGGLDSELGEKLAEELILSAENFKKSL